MHLKLLRALLLLLMLTTSASMAIAEQPSGDESDSSESELETVDLVPSEAAPTKSDTEKAFPDFLSIGALFLSASEPYSGVDREARVLPALGLQYKGFSFFGPIMSYRLFGGRETTSVHLLGEFRFFDGYEQSDAPILAGMDQRKGTVYLGAELKTKVSFLSVNVRALQDILGEHGGAQMELGLGFSVPLFALLKNAFRSVSLPFTLLSPKAGVRYYSTAYNNYYFGVKDNEVNAFRSAYRTSGGFAFFAQLGMWCKISERVSWSTLYSHEFLSKETKNSPLVDESSTNLFFTSLSYLFYL